jgi:hypothetical protein
LAQKLAKFRSAREDRDATLKISPRGKFGRIFVMKEREQGDQMGLLKIAQNVAQDVFMSKLIGIQLLP